MVYQIVGNVVIGHASSRHRFTSHVITLKGCVRIWTEFV